MTLAEVLEARGSPLDEDAVWCLLLATTEALLDISQKSKPYFTLYLVEGLFCSAASKSSQKTALL